jgi:hypothetical protein
MSLPISTNQFIPHQAESAESTIAGGPSRVGDTIVDRLTRELGVASARSNGKTPENHRASM